MHLRLHHFFFFLTCRRFDISTLFSVYPRLLTDRIIRRYNWRRYRYCSLAETTPTQGRTCIDIGSIPVNVRRCCIDGRARLCLDKPVGWLKCACSNFWSRQWIMVRRRNCMRTFVGTRITQSWTQCWAWCRVGKRVGWRWLTDNCRINVLRCFQGLTDSSRCSLKQHQQLTYNMQFYLHWITKNRKYVQQTVSCHQFFTLKCCRKFLFNSTTLFRF